MTSYKEFFLKHLLISFFFGCKIMSICQDELSLEIRLNLNNVMMKGWLIQVVI